MSITADVHRLLRLRQDHAAWTLLRADTAPAILALLGRHFGSRDPPPPAPELFARLDSDLQTMRDEA